MAFAVRARNEKRQARAKAKAFVPLRGPELLSLCVDKEKVTKEKGHPAWRLPGIHARQVRESGPGFSNGHPARAKRSRRPVDSRYAACRPRLTAAQGPRVEQRAILARTRCATDARRRNGRSSMLRFVYSLASAYLIGDGVGSSASGIGAPNFRLTSDARLSRRIRTMV